MLPTPKFHHLHLNSSDPGGRDRFLHTAVSEHRRENGAAFRRSNRLTTSWCCSTKADAPPTSEPQSAIWHFGWHVTDFRRSLETYKTRHEVELLPLYTDEEGGSVLISSDTWPGRAACWV